MRLWAILALMVVTSSGCPGFKHEDTGEWGQDDDDDGGSDPTDDTGADTDTEDPGVDGTYAGDASLDLTILDLVTTCSGPVGFVVDAGALSGALECTFPEGDDIAGALGLTDTYTAEMSGEVQPTGEGAGTFTLEIISEATADWTSVAGSSGVLEGAITGEIPMTGFEPALVDGTFTARRD